MQTPHSNLIWSNAYAKNRKNTNISIKTFPIMQVFISIQKMTYHQNVFYSFYLLRSMNFFLEGVFQVNATVVF